MAVWTAVLIRLRAPPHAVAIVLGLLCLTSAIKFIRDHSVEADRNSYTDVADYGPLAATFCVHRGVEDRQSYLFPVMSALSGPRPATT
ncbi:hypothetical protein C8R47DRAFT_1228241 [Mycena vitilis]|nr:hypothetical protein C8R47DRAFT_1228241 [Mycena vitilis]